MKRISLMVAAAAALIATAAPVSAQSGAAGPAAQHGPADGHGPMMRHGMGPGMGAGMGHGPIGLLTRRDDRSAADMAVVMNLVHANAGIRRTVTRLPDGIRTVTESDDPRIAQDIKVHVASMSQRLTDGREFNIFSTTLPVIFDNAKRIRSTVEFTDKGAIVTRTSTDPQVAAALQAHADEVTELVAEGPVAFHRGIDARMAMGPDGPRGPRAAARPGSRAPSPEQAH